MIQHTKITQSVITQYWTASTQSAVRLAVAVLAIAYILYLLSQITWQIIPEPKAPSTVRATAPSSVTVSNNSNNKNINILLSQKIFGDKAAEPNVVEQDVTDAPETKLNLTLNGVVASTEKNSGAAIISRGNNQATYGIGDKIDGTQATLHQVFADRVILSNRGSKETLMLDGLDFVKASEAQVIQSKPVIEEVPSIPTLDQDMVAKLRKDPTQFADFIAINPARINDEIVGYRVSPGRQPEFFARAGLKAGDVIIGLNGLDLTLPREAMRAMQSLKTSDTLALTILRNGNTQSLTLTLPGQ